ncbi:hypothetical protein CRYUN_Cryun03dG0044800 [Craigia yunnanensis]
MISKAPWYVLPLAWAWTGTAITGFKHERHHAKTSMLSEDTAWHPVWEEEFETSPFLRKAIIFGYGPFRSWMSIAYWLIWHFDVNKFRPNEHHTAPHITFKTSDEWNAAQAQLNGTVHCDYPRWRIIICHDINVHIPHHISSRIPSYNLRAAHMSIQENWGPV